MTDSRWLLLAGAGSFLVGLLAGLPAQLGLRLVGVKPAQTSGVSGSVWQGEARSIDLRSLQLNQVQWNLSALGVLAGQLTGQASAEFSGGRASGIFVAGVTGGIGCRDCEIKAAMDGLRGLVPVRGLAGQLDIHFDSFEWRRGWIRRAVGTASIENMPLTLGGQPALAGMTAGYSAKFTADPVPKSGDFDAEVTDTAGPLKVEAKLHMSPPGNYELAGKVTPRPGAPQPVVNGVQLLGPRLPDGGYSVTFAGSF